MTEKRRPKMLGDYQQKCDPCGEPVWIVGTGKKQREECGCEPAPVVEKQGRRKCSPKGAKAKGDGFEREICKAAEDWGWTGKRTPGSGAFGSRTNEQAFATDVRLQLGDLTIRAECKRHASVAGLKSLLKLRDNSEILIVREDFSEAFVLAPLSTFGTLAALVAEAKR